MQSLNGMQFCSTHVSDSSIICNHMSNEGKFLQLARKYLVTYNHRNRSPQDIAFFRVGNEKLDRNSDKLWNFPFHRERLDRRLECNYLVTCNHCNRSPQDRTFLWVGNQKLD